MEQTAGGEGGQSLVENLVSVSGAFEGSEDIAVARDLARSFLSDVQAVHGLPVSGRAMGMIQLVVSELVTNARKYAPGPCLLTLEVTGGSVKVTVWLEIVMAACQSFTVHREPVGKRITTAIVLADDPGGDVTGRRL
jgi:two-component sensor histidine kinase